MFTRSQLKLAAAIASIRILRLYTKNLCGAYDGYLMWAERRGHWQSDWRHPYFLMALGATIEDAIFGLPGAFVDYQLQYYLERQFPTRAGPKIQWLSLVIKWLLENVLKVAIGAFVPYMILGPRLAILPHIHEVALSAVRRHFLKTCIPTTSLICYFLPLQYRVQTKDIAEMAWAMFCIAVVRMTMPPLADGPDPKILEAIRKHSETLAKDDL